MQQKQILKISQEFIYHLLLKKVHLAGLKPHVEQLNVAKSKNIPTNLSNLKSKVDKLDVDKLLPVTVDLS